MRMRRIARLLTAVAMVLSWVPQPQSANFLQVSDHLIDWYYDSLTLSGSSSMRTLENRAGDGSPCDYSLLEGLGCATRCLRLISAAAFSHALPWRIPRDRKTIASVRFILLLFRLFSPAGEIRSRKSSPILAGPAPGVYRSSMDLADFRKEYSDRGLKREELEADPVAQFSTWFSQATTCGVYEPNAMTLATVDESGTPYQRTVLLKYYDEDGFLFFTNYESRKAKQIAQNPKVSLLFPWLILERQVSIIGSVEKISNAESLNYFMQRPRESQIGAWVSNQSEVITSRKFLIQKMAEITDQFSHGEVPLPPFWGGYRVSPETIEFWQGGPARLHDRFLYQRKNDGWKIDRLSP